MNRQFKFGDPIEIKFATHDGHIWTAAKVVKNDRAGIVAEFSDGRRQAVPHGEGHYRAPTSNGESA